MRDALTLSELFLLLITIILLVFLAAMKPDFTGTQDDRGEVQDRTEPACSDVICEPPVFVQKGS